MLTDNEYQKKPVFCISEFGEDAFEVIEEDDEHLKTKLVFSNFQKQELAAEFGDYALLINARRLIDAMNHAFKEANLRYVYGKVMYDDFSVNSFKRTESFLHRQPSLFFWKDKSLEYQREFRIVVLSTSVEDHFILNIGDMTDYSMLLPAEILLNGRFGRTGKKGMKETW